MVIKVFAVFDCKAECYGTPLFFKTSGEAIRSFSDESNRDESMLFKHPGDYTLFEVGTWDDCVGQFVPLEAKRSLGLAIDYKRQLDLPIDSKQGKLSQIS